MTYIYAGSNDQNLIENSNSNKLTKAEKYTSMGVFLSIIISMVENQKVLNDIFQTFKERRKRNFQK